MKLALDVVQARLRAPAVSSREALEVRPLVLVRVEGADGVPGFGEAAPLEGYDGVRLAAVLGALENCRHVLETSDGEDRAALLAACSERAALPQALAAIDLALWDRAGRRAGAPVWRLLGGARPPEVKVNATIAVADRSSAASAAASARADGFGCVKVKVGIGDDAGRLAAIRALAGPEMEIRLDANGAWSVPEALANLRVLEPVGLECCEEPVSGLEAIAALGRQTLVPLALDESAALPGALEHRVCDAVCLKIARCGGITGLLESARRARAAGYELYLASTYDGPLGIAAALHAATAVRPDRPCGLATIGIFAHPNESLAAKAGVMRPPSGAGLGDGLERWYEHA